jgi:hypothetical protein
MCVDFYTYDDRKSGQRATRGARSLCERTVIQTPPQRLAIKTLVVLIERVSVLGKRRWRHKT